MSTLFQDMIGFLVAFVFGPMGGSFTMKWIYSWESLKVGLLIQFSRERVGGPRYWWDASGRTWVHLGES